VIDHVGDVVAEMRRGDVDGMSRRLFAVLPAGARALAESKAMRERLWRGVDLRGLLGATT